MPELEVSSGSFLSQIVALDLTIRPARKSLAAGAAKSSPHSRKGNGQTRRGRAPALQSSSNDACFSDCPPHPPQCAHWGTFPPGGKAFEDHHLRMKQKRRAARRAAQRDKREKSVERLPLPVQHLPPVEGDEIGGQVGIGLTEGGADELRIQPWVLGLDHRVQGEGVALALQVEAAD